jgi:hypothetical protein
MIRCWSGFAIVVAAIVSCGGQVAKGNPHVDIFVGQYPEVGGGFNYQLTAFGPIFGTLTAANGQSYFVQKTFGSFEDLGTVLFGNWSDSIPGLNGSFVFDVKPFTLADVASETPVIVSPTPGSTVPENFVVKWAFPGGETPSATRAIVLNPTDKLILESLALGVDGPYSEGVGSRLVGSGPVSLPVKVEVLSNLPNPEVIDRSPSLNGQHLYATLTFGALSATATYQVVVPEPTSAALVAFAAMIFGMQRSRKRSV